MGDGVLNNLNIEGTLVARPPAFDGTNYQYWKRRMQFYFQGINWDLWRMVSTPYTLPQDDFAVWDANTVKMAQMNAKAVSILYCSISVGEFNRVSNCDTAYDIWHRLSITYEGTVQVKNSKVSLLKTKFEHFRMDPNETISEMYSKFSTIVNGLSALGKPVLEEDQVSKILRSLPPKYKPKVTAIAEANDLTRLKMEQLIGNLEAHEADLEEEERREHERQHGKKKDIAFKASTKDTSEDDSEEETLIVNGKQYKSFKTNKTSSASSSRCFECGKKGHMKGECPKLKKGKKSSYKKKERAYRAAWDDSSDDSDSAKEDVECFIATTNEDEEEVSLYDLPKEDLIASLQDTHEKYIECKKKLKKSNKDLNALLSENENLKKENEEYDLKLKSVEADCNLLSLEKLKLQNQVNDLQKQPIVCSHLDYDKVVKERNALVSNLDQAKKDIARLQRNVNELGGNNLLDNILKISSSYNGRKGLGYDPRRNKPKRASKTIFVPRNTIPRNRNEVDAISCHYCMRLGHYSFSCPFKKKKDELAWIPKT